MQPKIRVIQYGVGAMGGNMVRLLRTKPDVEIVGAIDWDKAKIGRDVGDLAGLGEKLGVEVQYPPQKVLDRVEADVILHATTAFLEEAQLQIIEVLDRKINVVTIAQELFFPIGENVSRAANLDEKAKAAGVSLTATGINPGFIMDILPIVCSFPCWRIDRLSVKRNVDFSPYGPDEMLHIGANLTPEQFQQGVQDGTIGHIGLLETAAMAAHCMGIEIDRLEQTKKPVIAKGPRKTNFINIEPGRVCGFRQNVSGMKGHQEILRFEMVGLLDPNPEEDGIELGDHARIEGIPNVDIQVKEEISQKGGLGTAAAAVNMIPKVLNAPPGYHPMNRLGLPTVWSGHRTMPPPIRIISGGRSE